jgi:hypothetical protein
VVVMGKADTKSDSRHPSAREGGSGAPIVHEDVGEMPGTSHFQALKGLISGVGTRLVS